MPKQSSVFYTFNPFLAIRFMVFTIYIQSCFTVSYIYTTSNNFCQDKLLIIIIIIIVLSKSTELLLLNCYNYVLYTCENVDVN